MSITRINNNIAAISATRNLESVSSRLSKNIERLSSGLRINRAGDDAAGLTIRERLRTQIRGTGQAIDNAQNGISMVNTAEAALESLVSSLQRIRELAIQAGNTGTNDASAIQAIQDEVFQQIDEVNRIASTARFSTRLLFTGDNSNASAVKKGQEDIGVRTSSDPNASNLHSGSSILNIVRNNQGSENLLPYQNINKQALYATGVKDTTDIAVTTGQFVRGVSVAYPTAVLRGFSFNGISLTAKNIISFQGVLSDGVTPFAGSISVGNLNSFTTLRTGIQTAIDNAETALFGGRASGIPSSFVQTVVSLSSCGVVGATLSIAQGRFKFISAMAPNGGNALVNDRTSAPSQFQINFTVLDSQNKLKASMRTTRDFVKGQNAGAQVGNKVQGITGSTFDTGNFKIDVSDIIPPNRRKLETNLIFRDPAGTVISRTAPLIGNVLNGTFVGAIFTTNDTGILFQLNDTITIQGTNKDGSTFSTAFTITNTAADDTNRSDGKIYSISGLVKELNYRIAQGSIIGHSNGVARVSSGFSDSVVTLTGNGTLQIIDDVADTSQTSLFMIAEGDNRRGDLRTLTDRATVLINGNAEEATVSIDGGLRQRVKMGDVVTLYGPEPTRIGENQQHLTMRMGGGFRVTMSNTIFMQGSDTAEITAQQFVGSLNGGPQVTFQNGDKNVFFESGVSAGVAESLMMDFADIIDVTGPPMDGSPNTGRAVVLSTINQALNFQVGPFQGQDLQVNIPDLRADNIGYGHGSGKTVSIINVTTVSGVNMALDIVDKALDQISRARAALGAFTNRLETTIGSLSVGKENLSASESRLSDVDITTEVAAYTSNQIIFQAGTSVLAQANTLPQGLLSLLR